MELPIVIEESELKSESTIDEEGNQNIDDFQLESNDDSHINDYDNDSSSSFKPSSEIESEDDIRKKLRKRKKRVSTKNILKKDDITYLKECDLPYVISENDIKKPFQCRFCEERCIRLSTLVQHIFKKHDGIRVPMGDHIMFRCEDCNKVFPKHGIFIKHRMSHMNLAVLNPHSCNICGKSFEYKYMVKRHIISSHSSTTPYQCGVCNRYFGQKSHLDRHTKSHLVKDLQCSHCSLKFKNKFHFQCHIKTHENDRPFKCHLCRKTYLFQFHLDTHLKMHYKKGGLKCETCKKFVGTKNNLQRHYKTHISKPGIQCKLCDSLHTNKKSMLDHIKDNHLNIGELLMDDFNFNDIDDDNPIALNDFKLQDNLKENGEGSDVNNLEMLDDDIEHNSEESMFGSEDMAPYLEIKTETFDNETINLEFENATQFLNEIEKPHKCHVCKKTFKFKSKLKSHMAIHKMDKTYNCKVCKRTFTMQKYLNQHMVSHKEIFNKCNLCSKQFRHMKDLKHHLLAHDGSKPYKCTHCGKSFAYKKTLHVHNKIHIGIKKHNCMYCDKSFFEKSCLNTHVATHTREGQFLCAHCDKNFFMKSQLKRHIKRSHLKIKPHKCQLCNDKFSETHILKRHLAACHSEKNKIVCNVCFRTYATSTKLELHLEKSPKCQSNHIQKVSCESMSIQTV